jgi:glyoxylase-like metal-dependent hydrolase (beta-lactamase superfamily II)
LLEYPHGLFLIDSGSPGMQAPVLEKMKQLGRADLKVIWITHAHYDHYGSAAALRKLTGARIGVHPADAKCMSAGQSPLGSTRRYGFIYPVIQPMVGRMWPLLATPVDFTMDDGETLERFGLEATILYTPGHTPGHTCVLLSDGTAFAADLIARNPRPRLQDLLATDWSQLPGSLERLKSVHPRRVFTGHSRVALPGELLQKIMG